MVNLIVGRQHKEHPQLGNDFLYLANDDDDENNHNNRKDDHYEDDFNKDNHDEDNRKKKNRVKIVIKKNLALFDLSMTFFEGYYMKIVDDFLCFLVLLCAKTGKWSAVCGNVTYYILGKVTVYKFV